MSIRKCKGDRVIVRKSAMIPMDWRGREGVVHATMGDQCLVSFDIDHTSGWIDHRDILLVQMREQESEL